MVGGGTMGLGFAQLLALAGIPCTIADAGPERSHAARERAVASAGRLAAAGLLPPDAAERVADGLEAPSTTARAVEAADVVFEAVPEDPGLKARVLADIEDAAAADCVIATNTSAIPIADLAATLRHPERFLGAHWFNPPQWVPGVEVIPGPSTLPEHVDAVVTLLVVLGKRPSVVGDGPGFVANRIQFAMFREAAAVVADGIAPAEVVDEVVRATFGFRLPLFGPFAIADMAGLDVYAGAYAALAAGLGERMAAPPAVVERVAEGRLGTKSGGGFLELSAQDGDRMTAWRDKAYTAMAGLLEQLGSWRARP